MLKLNEPAIVGPIETKFLQLVYSAKTAQIFWANKPNTTELKVKLPK